MTEDRKKGVKDMKKKIIEDTEDRKRQLSILIME